MLAHYLNMGFRSIRRERFLSTINLAGLAAGLASVILIFLHVSSELGHDRWIPGHERLYRIDTVETVPGQAPNEIANAPGPLRDALPRAFPDIEEIARAYSAPLTVEREGRPFAEDVLVADPNFLTLLNLPLRSGDGARALAGPASVALSARAARKYFGDTDPVGRTLAILTPERRDFIGQRRLRDDPPQQPHEVRPGHPATRLFPARRRGDPQDPGQLGRRLFPHLRPPQARSRPRGDRARPPRLRRPKPAAMADRPPQDRAARFLRIPLHPDPRHPFRRGADRSDEAAGEPDRRLSPSRSSPSSSSSSRRSTSPTCRRPARR